ncbi:MAG: VWA domain-containing protein [Myxococcota bacterium]|nr:VWA domain-containing protein [Myxococcota bacterium]MDP7297909.1 VWA domain-containing protein [Myxococcota bacterium]
MTGFENFHFLRPAWLFALALLVPALWAALRQRRSAGAWRRVCDPELLRHLVVDGGGRSSRTVPAVFAVAWTAACLALAGPTWERLPQPAFKEPVQTVLALSLAPSMNARDVAPTRLARARYEALDVLERVEGAAGLVIFAEEPYPVTPLTDDPSVIASQVPLLESRLMPGRGAHVGRAIDQARELLTQAGAAQGRVLLLGDGLGDVPEAALEAAQRAEAAGYPVSVLGIGGDAEALEALAEAGGGRFASVRADDSDLDYLLGGGSGSASLLATAQQSGLKADAWNDVGAWLVLLPLLLVPLAFRRGWAAALGVMFFLPAVPQTATAGVAEWFARPDQQGAAALEQGDAAGAAELFEDPEWRSAALYRSGEYEAAAQMLQGQDDGRSQYNLGNALARANRFEESIAAYGRVLEIEPDHEDARFNRELVEKLLEQQQQEQQQQEQQQQQQPQQEQASQGGGQSEESEQDESSQEDPSSGSENESAQSDTDEAGAGQDSAQSEPEGAQSEPEGAQSKSEAEGSEAQAENSGESQSAENPAAGQGESEAPEPQTAESSAPSESQQASAEPRGGAGGQQTEPAQPRPEAGRSTAGAGGDQDAPDQTGRPMASGGSGRELSEEDQEAEQWLNRVPDDPGGLLREKLRRRYAERRYGANGSWR